MDPEVRGRTCSALAVWASLVVSFQVGSEYRPGCQRGEHAPDYTSNVGHLDSKVEWWQVLAPAVNQRTGLALYGKLASSGAVLVSALSGQSLHHSGADSGRVLSDDMFGCIANVHSHASESTSLRLKCYAISLKCVLRCISGICLELIQCPLQMEPSFKWSRPSNGAVSSQCEPLRVGSSGLKP